MPWFLLLMILVLTPTKALGGVPEAYPQVKVKASFDLKAHEVKGEVRVILPPDQVVQIDVQHLTLKEVRLGRRPWHPTIQNGGFQVKASSPGEVLQVSFSARFQGQGSRISGDGIVLTEHWFPSVEGLAFYDLEVLIPEGLRAVAPADSIMVSPVRGGVLYRFSFPHPSPPPPMVAGRYALFEETRGDLTVAVYLLKKDPALAKVYLKKAWGYLQAYSQLLGPYPYKRFAVVENFFETGYAYPTMTLLGHTVIHLPFIPATSLRHEILHNWFGNGVFVDWPRGNWCEGLVTYLADHQRAVEQGQGADYRHQLLVDYQSYVSPEVDFPLKDFRGRYNRASQAIGYAKGAMFFHMLRREVGEKTFLEALRAFYRKYLFRPASWQDIERVFETVSKKDLSAFFRQWLDRRGLPRLSLYRERILPLGKDKYVVGLTIVQERPFYRLRLPLAITSTKETKRIEVLLSGPRTRVDVKITGSPLVAKLDPDYDVARYLSPPEFPPVLARLLGAQEGLLILSKTEEEEVYRPLEALFRGKNFVLQRGMVEPESRHQVLIYCGELPTRLRPLFQLREKGDFVLEVQENPVDPEHILVWIKAKDREAVERVLPKLPHLGRYQKICALKGRLLVKEKAPYEKGIEVRLLGETWGLDLRELRPLEAIAQAVSLDQIVFLGEEHDHYEHHLAQLAIIKWLYEHGHHLAIGMEMFQRPFQAVLDRYLAGEIDEVTFLRETEYFKRWGFNWRLYKPILDYAREHHIPVVALNAPKELTGKVAKKGLKALSPKERKELPQIDFENQAYREYLRRVYEAHPERLPDIKDFDTFYQAQLLWDETMAQSIADYLRRHPDTQMVVLVGKAHVMYGYGIPSRVARRGFPSYSIVLLGGDQLLEPGVGDYVLFPRPQKPPFFAYLGVLIEEGKGRLKIKQVLPGRPAAKAGLKKGDLILKADDQVIRNVADLKLVLYQKGPKDKVKLLIKRHGKTKIVWVGPFTEGPKHH